MRAAPLVRSNAKLTAKVAISEGLPLTAHSEFHCHLALNGAALRMVRDHPIIVIVTYVKESALEAPRTPTRIETILIGSCVRLNLRCL